MLAGSDFFLFIVFVVRQCVPHDPELRRGESSFISNLLTCEGGDFAFSIELIYSLANGEYRINKNLNRVIQTNLPNVDL